MSKLFAIRILLGKMKYLGYDDKLYARVDSAMKFAGAIAGKPII